MQLVLTCSHALTADLGLKRALLVERMHLRQMLICSVLAEKSQQREKTAAELSQRGCFQGVDHTASAAEWQANYKLLVGPS